MADKFLVAGCSFCGKGDGPLIPTEAAHNDATGYAWGLTSTDTDAINIVTGGVPKFGTLGAGDSVYIRSKTRVGADITVTLAAALTVGPGAATEASPIMWILDNGTVWTGVDGILTYTSSVVSRFVTVSSHHILISKTLGAWRFIQTIASPGDGTLLQINEGAEVVRALIDHSARTGATAACDLKLRGIARDCQFKFGPTGTSSITVSTDRAEATLINPDIELISIVNASTSVLFSAVGGDRHLTVIGGRTYGAGSDAGVGLFRAATVNTGQQIKLIGHKYPNTMRIDTPLSTISNTTRIQAYGIDAKNGSLLTETWGWASSRSDNNPPVLNALLPGSSEKWAWRVYPVQAGRTRPMQLALNTVYSGTPSTQTLTVEVLVANTFSGVNKNTLWVDLSYTDDTTGNPVLLSTKADSGALDTSTAPWFPATLDVVSWGLTTFDKRKFTLTTPTAIKQHTPVLIMLSGTVKAASVNDIYFVCPAVQLS
ncbi:MAG: hypothetical protein KGZ88_11850 [Methylomicrobium sp.]|nr:hypothetical protein [Methylomicrobium sp.]